MKYWLLLFLICPMSVSAQDTIHLWQCYQWSTENDPTATLPLQLAQQTALQQENINAQLLPNLQLKARATYQSDVPSLDVDLPMIDLPMPQQDQYAVTVEAQQPIYTGGRITAQRAWEASKLATQQQQVAEQQYQRNHLINRYYFESLQYHWQSQVLHLQASELQAQLQQLQAAIEEGAALASAPLALEAQLLQIHQQIQDTKANQQQALQALALLTGQSIDTSTYLSLPAADPVQSFAIAQRPEWHTFDLQQEQLVRQADVLDAQRQPSLGAFATAGYGRPGLNPFETTFQPYYIAGLQLQWQLWDWSTTKRQKASLQVQHDILEQKREAFTEQQQLQFYQLSSKRERLEASIITDKTLIEKREALQAIASDQLKEGVITPQAYIMHTTATQQARWQLKGHEIQLAWLTVQQYTLLGQVDALTHHHE